MIRCSDALDPAPNRSNFMGFVILAHVALKVLIKFFSTDFSIFGLLDIICEGKAHAAANVIVEVSMSNAVRNRLA